MNRPRRRIVRAPITVAQAQAIAAVAARYGWGDLFDNPTKKQVKRLEAAIRNLQEGIHDTLNRCSD